VEAYYGDIQKVLAKLRASLAQFDIDGTHNVWIVKPGAKSRGRGKYKVCGIVCLNFSLSCYNVFATKDTHKIPSLFHCICNTFI